MQKTQPKNLYKKWLKIYSKAPDTLAKTSKITQVACAFNTCIDSVVKMSGKQISEMINKNNLSVDELQSVDSPIANSVSSIIKGIFKCFTNGIAEEWISEKYEIFEWMVHNLGTQKIQTGGQAGIIANTLSLTPINKIILHSNALTKLQAEQLYNRPNLLSFDADGNLFPAAQISRDKTSSIHWIVEFDKGDKITVKNQEFICPKSNRFIITYDPPLFDFVVDEKFLQYTYSHQFDYFILSGYQALSSDKNGIKHIKNSVHIIDNWKKSSPKSIIHLEIASTQDLKIRKAIVQHLANKVDSIGVNEREAIDILQVINQKKLAEKCSQNPSSINMFEAIIKIKEKIKCPRIQLHMFGLYITIQDKKYKLKPSSNLKGMTLAATAAASKAFIGELSKPEDILKSQGMNVSDIGINELTSLSKHIKNQNLATTGICEYKGFDIIAVPTIIIDKPKTLVGMGDTISSFSIIGAG